MERVDRSRSPVRDRKGGHRQQRTGVASAAIRAVRFLCPFVTGLLKRWAWGQLSAVDVQDISHRAKLAGLQSAENDELARIGGWGSVTGHMQRDLMTTFCKDHS